MSRQLELILAVIALVLAAALLVVPWARAAARRTAVRRWARDEFASDDPARRAAAAVTLISLGLSRTAEDVLGFVTTESNDAVLDQVADAASHHRWEPNTGPDAVAVKAWATARRRWAAGELSAPVASGVLVTGAGGPAGVAVIRELVRLGYRVHGVDSSPDAAGLALARTGAVVPMIEDPGFPEALLREVDGSQATVVIATLDEEFSRLRVLLDPLTERGVALWLPDQAAVDTCQDKLAFAQACLADGIETPATALLPASPDDVRRVASAVPAPWIVKPQFGRGSRHVHACDAVDELVIAARWAAPAIVQTRATGREFTADVLIDRDGTLLACVPRWRLATRSGVSTVGQTFRDEAVQAAVLGLVQAIGLTGVCNVQGFVEESGRVVIIECNTRFSGGLPLSLGAGCDLVGQYVRISLGLPAQPGRLGYTPGTLMTRWFDESIRPGALP